VPVPEEKKKEQDAQPLKLSLEELQRKKKMKVNIRGQDVLVVFSNGRVYAIDNVCSRE
jgi:nitrite reductase/ring-hydroxylating ferredoxin subunit